MKKGITLEDDMRNVMYLFKKKKTLKQRLRKLNFIKSEIFKGVGQVVLRR